MKFLVIALSVHSDLTQRIYPAGSIVGEEEFPDGHPADLVEKGFLKPLDDRAQLVAHLRSSIPAGVDPASVTDGHLQIMAEMVVKAFDRDPHGAANVLEFYDGVTSGAIKVDPTAEELAELEKLRPAAGDTGDEAAGNSNQDDAGEQEKEKEAAVGDAANSQDPGKEGETEKPAEPAAPAASSAAPPAGSVLEQAKAKAGRPKKDKGTGTEAN